MTKDGRTTGTRLVSVASDALQQVQKTEGRITGFSTPTATRLRTGAWSVSLAWTTPTGEVHQTLKV